METLTVVVAIVAAFILGVGAGGWATAKQKDTGTTFKKFEESDLPEGFVKLERVVETLLNPPLLASVCVIAVAIICPIYSLLF